MELPELQDLKAIKVILELQVLLDLKVNKE